MAEQHLTLPGTIVKKSNTLARARWPVGSVLEPRLVALVASRVHVADEDLHSYIIPAHEVLGRDYGGDHQQRLAEVVDNLMGRVLTLEDAKGWTKYTLFSRCRYHREGGVLEVQIHPDLKPHFLGLKERFAYYQLMEYLILPSTYSQRLFEILKSWDDQPETTIEIEELRQMMGVPEGVLPRYQDFRRKCLEKAHEHIHKHTSLKFDWEPVKRGRSIAAVRFIFSKKRAATTKANITKREAEVNRLKVLALACASSKKPCKYDRSCAKCIVCKEMKFK